MCLAVFVCLKRILYFYAAVRADAVKHGEDVQEYYERLISSKEDKVTTM